MAHNDSFVKGDQNPKPSHANSKPVNDKLTYRLFPTANQQPQTSPKTLQHRTLHSRHGSFNKRRSASLDDSSRPHGMARMPFSRPSDAPAPRLQNVPANRVRVTQADAQDRTCTSNYYCFLAAADTPEAQSPKVLSYKPMISEDAGHGRSSSAPDDMRAELRTRKPTGLAHMTSAAISSSAKAVRGLGGTWYNPHDSTIGGPMRQDSHRRYNRRDAILEKPLPPPPRETALDPYHNRSHSTPLSPGLGSSSFTGARSDSVTGLTPLVTPSSLDPSRKSYFPLSSDAQMRQLMGFLPVEDDEDGPARFNSHGKSQGTSPSLTLPSSKYQRQMDVPAITVQAESVDAYVNMKAETSQPSSATSEPLGLVRPSLGSPTLSQASTIMVPAALRITSPKRSVSVNSTLDRRPLPAQAKLRAANDIQPTQALSNAIISRDDELATTLSLLSELTTQTDNLHARYATLREDRQMILGEITQGLKEQRAGPDYVNTIFDQHMSLSTVCSSMDICLAKLKAVARRKDTLVKTIATQKTPTPTNALLSSINEQKPTSVPTSARSTPAISSSHKMSYSTPPSLLPPTVYENKKPVKSEAVQRFRSQLDIDYDTDDSDAPRRMNIKGAKAAKILGLALEPNNNPEPRSTGPNSARPIHNLKANHSTSSLDRDHFTRAPSPAPAPSRPLPSRPSVRMKQRDHVPAPLPLRQTERSVVEKPSHTAQRSVDDSTVSSRASSPAEDRGAETPLEEYPAFDAKSPGMQTVHVYFPDSLSCTPSLHSSTFSEVGEDELLEYYGYLR